MTRKAYDILCTVTEHLKGDDFGICSNIRVRDLFPGVRSDFMLEGVWLFYRSSINEIFYYTGVSCDVVYSESVGSVDRFIYLYKLE